MSDDLDFEMEVVENDDLDDLDDGSGSSSGKNSVSDGKEKTPNDLKSENPKNIELRSEAGPEESNSVRTAPTINPDVDGWSRIRLGEFASFQNGNAFSKSEWGEEGCPIIRIQNLTGETDEYNYYDGDLEGRYRVDPGDTLLTWSGTIGVFKWEGPDAALNQHIFKVETRDEVNDSFFHFKLDELIPQLEALSHGSTMKHVRKADLVNIDVELPPLPEQRKIASVLYTVDQAIQKTETIIEQAKQVKRGLMQDLLTGERRLPRGSVEVSTAVSRFSPENESEDYPVEWEQVPLGSELLRRYGGDTPSVSVDEYWDGNVLWLSNSEVTEGEVNLVSNTERRITQDGLESCTAQIVPPGSVILSCTASIGKVAINEKPMATNQQFNSFKPVRGFNSYYLANQLLYRKQILETLGGSTTHNHLPIYILEKFSVPRPPVPEQERIGTVLFALDKQIESGRSKMKSLSVLKKGLMQDLLTGEVRTADKAIEVLNEVEAHG